MKIAVIHSYYSASQPSGENVVVSEQVEQLRRAGHEVVTIVRRTDDLAGSRAYPIRAAATTVTGLRPSPAKTLQAVSPDVIHVHNTFPNWGTRWLRQWGSRTVLTLHNYRPVCAAGTLFRDGRHCEDCLLQPALPAIVHRCYRGSRIATVPLALASAPGGSLRQAVQLANRVIALNSNTANLFDRVFHRKIDVVPNFVPYADRAEATRGWAYVGRLAPEKGVDRLLEDWPASEMLDVIGDGPLRGVLEQATRSSTNVAVRGALPRHDLLAELGTYTGVILPSRWSEGLPTVILEAMARGVPLVLSNRIAAAAELCAGGAATSYDLDGGETELRGALTRLRGARTAMSLAATEMHGRRYSPAAWQSAIDALYDSVRRSA